jgi:hypothetical protein
MNVGVDRSSGSSCGEWPEGPAIPTPRPRPIRAGDRYHKGLSHDAVPRYNIVLASAAWSTLV